MLLFKADGNSKLRAAQTGFLINNWLCLLTNKYFSARQNKKQLMFSFSAEEADNFFKPETMEDYWPSVF